MQPEKLLPLLAHSISRKAKSFIRYRELSQLAADNEKLQQVLEEIIRQEQKHFETVNEILSQLIEEKNEKAGDADDIFIQELINTRRSLQEKWSHYYEEEQKTKEVSLKKNEDRGAGSDSSVEFPEEADRPEEQYERPEGQTGESNVLVWTFGKNLNKD
ncbi:MAG: hypothetical protein GXZ07_09665 [Firmicutes bacterium]|nr:hypothetical protein [Bacillota bacterium]